MVGLCHGLSLAWLVAAFIKGAALLKVGRVLKVVQWVSMSKATCNLSYFIGAREGHRFSCPRVLCYSTAGPLLFDIVTVLP